MKSRMQGSVAIEFAIVFPLFLLMLYAIISYAICFAVMFTLHGLSGDAARAVLSLERISLATDPSLVEAEIDRVLDRSWLDDALVRGCVDGERFRFEDDVLEVCLEVPLAGSGDSAADTLALPRLTLMGVSVPHLDTLSSSSSIGL